jgi:hypothetical protein
VRRRQAINDFVDGCMPNDPMDGAGWPLLRAATARVSESLRAMVIADGATKQSQALSISPNAPEWAAKFCILQRR